MAEDVAVAVHEQRARRLGEELGGTLGKPEAGVGDDQRDAAQAALFEMT